MSRKRFSEEQIIPILKRHEAGVPTQELCREIGVTTATFYNWKAKYGGLELSDARRLKGVEADCSRPGAGYHGAEGDLPGKLLKPRRRRKAAEHLVRTLGLKKAKASKVSGMARSGHYYRFRLRLAEPGIVNRMKERSEERRV